MPRQQTHGTSAIDPNAHYTYRDYKTWPEDERWELINGKAVPLYGMSPAPKLRHQTLLFKLASQLDAFFEGKPCHPFISPVDVFFPKTGEALDENDQVVQPDLFVVCDQAKLFDEGIHGAPDFIIEILSPSTALRDQSDKRALYEEGGVREYWIVNPDTLEAFIYTLTEGSYGLPRVADLREPTPSSIFQGLTLKARKADL